MKKKIPRFRSEEEERDFWQTHDSTEYVDWKKAESVNDTIGKALSEDAEDATAFEERAKEPIMSYDEMVKRLKKDGRILVGRPSY